MAGGRHSVRGERFCDCDHRDHSSFHITVRVGDRLVGCVRTMLLSSERMDAVLDDVMGHGNLDRCLGALKVRRDRLSGKPLPQSEPVRVGVFEDVVRPMYAWANAPGHGIASLVGQMSSYYFGSEPAMAAAV
jgi:hypothetical protein